MNVPLTHIRYEFAAGISTVLDETTITGPLETARRRVIPGILASCKTAEHFATAEGSSSLPSER